MEIQKLTDRLRTLMAQHDDLMDAITAHIEGYEGFAMHFSVERIEFHAARTDDFAQARRLITQQLRNLNYSGDNKTVSDPFQSGAVAIDPEVRPLIEAMNDVKADMAKWLTDIRATQPTEVEKSQVVRRTLAKIGHAHLNLVALTARYYLLHGDLISAGWRISQTYATARKTVADAIAALEDRGEKLGTHDYQDEIMGLQSLGLNTPLAQRLHHKPVEAIKFRATSVSLTGERVTSRGHGRYPLFYVNRSHHRPALTLPSNEPGAAGKKPTIDDSAPIARSLPNWFPYKATANKTEVDKDVKRNTSMPVRGLWIGQKNGTDCIMVGGKGMSTRSLSIKRHGFDAAWEKGVDLLIDAKILQPSERERAIAARQDVDEPCA